MSVKTFDTNIEAVAPPSLISTVCPFIASSSPTERSGNTAGQWKRTPYRGVLPLTALLLYSCRPVPAACNAWGQTPATPLAACRAVAVTAVSKREPVPSAATEQCQGVASGPAEPALLPASVPLLLLRSCLGPHSPPVSDHYNRAPSSAETDEARGPQPYAAPGRASRSPAGLLQPETPRALP